MAWEDESLIMLRAFVDDLDETAYTDDRLLQVLAVAAFQVNLEMSFANKYTVKMSDVSVAPDPTLAGTRDDSFLNLSCLKAACIIDQGSAVTAAKRAISVRDGGSSVNLQGVFAGKLALLEKGWCAVYQDAKFEYQAGLVRVAGACVCTPFRLYAWGGLQASPYPTPPF